VSHNKHRKWGAACYFSYNFLKCTNQSFIIQMDLLLMYQEFDYKTQKSTLIICIDWLTRKKIGQTRYANKWGTMKKYVGTCLILFVKNFKIC